VIFLEHAEHGYYGGSIAKHVIDTYFAKKEGRPLPVLQKPVPPGTIRVANTPTQPDAVGSPPGPAVQARPTGGAVEAAAVRR
jgi:hypothetical protein